MLSPIFGYGQIKATGVYDPETRSAIEKIERDHRLPVTGQIPERFVRELAAMTAARWSEWPRHCSSCY